MSTKTLDLQYLRRTNRKSQTRFRLVPKSMTLDDLEWPKCNALLQKKTLYGAHQKYFDDDRPTVSAAKCRPMILVSRNIRYMRIFATVLRGGGVKRQ